MRLKQNKKKKIKERGFYCDINNCRKKAKNDSLFCGTHDKAWKKSSIKALKERLK